MELFWVGDVEHWMENVDVMRVLRMAYGGQLAGAFASMLQEGEPIVEVDCDE